MQSAIGGIIVAVVVIILVVTLILYSFGLGHTFKVATDVAVPNTTTGRALASGSVLLVINMLLLALVSLGAAAAYFGNGTPAPLHPIVGMVFAGAFLFTFFVIACVGASSKGRNLKTVLAYVWVSLIFQIISLAFLIAQWFKSEASASVGAAARAARTWVQTKTGNGTVPSAAATYGGAENPAVQAAAPAKTWFGAANALVFGVAFLSVYGIVSCIYTLKQLHKQGVSDVVNGVIAGGPMPSSDPSQPLVPPA